MTANSHDHHHDHDHAEKKPVHPHAIVEGEPADRTRIHRLAMFLEAHFGDIELHMPEEDDIAEGDEKTGPALLVTVDETEAAIDLSNLVSLFSTSRTRPLMSDVLDYYQQQRSFKETG